MLKSDGRYDVVNVLLFPIQTNPAIVISYATFPSKSLLSDLKPLVAPLKLVGALNKSLLADPLPSLSECKYE